MPDLIVLTADDPVIILDEEESCSIIDIQSSPDATKDVMDLTGSPIPQPAADVAVQPAANIQSSPEATQDVVDLTGSPIPQPAADVAVQPAADIQSSPEATQDVMDLTGSPIPQPAAHVAVQPAAQPSAQLAAQPSAQPASQPAAQRVTQSAPVPAAGQGILYANPPDWITSESDSDSFLQPSRKAVQVVHTTWCATRLIILAMYLVVGKAQISNKGVGAYASPFCWIAGMHIIVKLQ